MMKVDILAHEPVFVDTWGWMSLGHQRDPRHSEVKQVFQEFRHHGIPIYTSDYVLNELITLLFRRESFGEAVRFVNGILTASALKHVRIEQVTSDRFFAAWALRKRYQDKPGISFTDLTSMVIMKERGIRLVLTEDEHFIKIGMEFSKIP